MKDKSMPAEDDLFYSRPGYQFRRYRANRIRTRIVRLLVWSLTIWSLGHFVAACAVWLGWVVAEAMPFLESVYMAGYVPLTGLLLANLKSVKIESEQDF